MPDSTPLWDDALAHIERIIDAHTNQSRTPSKAHRKWDGSTPYALHPLWCATTLATETTLDEQTRTDGFLALLYHDVLEDTTLPLPTGFSQRVQGLIAGMTFYGGSAEEEEHLWERHTEIRLLKLYDKVSNLLDGSWMTTERKERYERHTRRLLDDVLEYYGELNITRIAQAVLEGNA